MGSTSGVPPGGANVTTGRNCGTSDRTEETRGAPLQSVEKRAQVGHAKRGVDADEKTSRGTCEN